MNKKSITIVFDIGGVLVQFDHLKMCSNLSRLTGLSFAYLHQLILKEGLGEEHEKGIHTSRELYLRFEKEAPRTFSHEEFEEAISNIFTESLDALKIVQALKDAGYPLLLISNTCDAHFNFLQKHFSIFSYFDDAILSYEIKSRKPDSAIYEEVLKRSKTNVENILYIDDIAEYVKKGNEMGFKSHQFISYDGLKSFLVEEGISLELPL